MTLSVSRSPHLCMWCRANSSPSHIKSIEHLLALTRRLRELWVVGPLRKPGDGDDKAQESIRQDPHAFYGMLNAMRKEERMREEQEGHDYMAYKEEPLEGPPVHMKSEGGGR